jgi:hypothetical protein
MAIDRLRKELHERERSLQQARKERAKLDARLQAERQVACDKIMSYVRSSGIEYMIANLQRTIGKRHPQHYRRSDWCSGRLAVRRSDEGGPIFGVRCDDEGTFTFAGSAERRVPYSEWRNNPNRLEEGLVHAYKNPHLDEPDPPGGAIEY